MFQTPIPKPYGQGLKDKLNSLLKDTTPKKQQQIRRKSYPEIYKNGPMPTPGPLITDCCGLDTTEQMLVDFVTNRDFLLDIAGTMVEANVETINLLPNLTKTGELYLGTLMGTQALVIKTKKPMRDGYTDHMNITSYIPTMLENNPGLRVFAGFSLNKRGYWNYHKTCVIEHDGQFAFIENDTDDVAYFGTIYPVGDPGPARHKPKWAK